jgi:hypothetical protein
MTTMATEPTKVTVRMYNVGFGDCFLLTFHYERPLADQHILIDFGTVGGKANMNRVAKAIKEACGGKLYAVIATHRHRDHISGFSDAAGEDSTGAIIASCKPEVVLQPWTENPDAAADADSAALLATRQDTSDKKLFLASLNAMSSFSATAEEYAKRWRGGRRNPTTLEKLASNNVKNPDAVRNLRTMGKRKPRFLQYDSPSGLENSKLLPGVKVHVLGPPALRDQNIRKYAKNSDEYWISSKYWGLQERASGLSGGTNLFPRQLRYEPIERPIHTRWFTERADNALMANALGIVTVLDNFLNNTSLILLFEVRGKKLLFPGDAQLENWSYALEQKKTRNLLRNVDLYKVGHHGSRNATPKSLWELFDKRKNRVLKTMLSTSSGVYHRSEEGKVPSDRLVTTLTNQSHLQTTQSLKSISPPPFEF